MLNDDNLNIKVVSKHYVKRTGSVSLYT